MGESVSLLELVVDEATIPVTLAGRTFDVTYTPSNISGRLMQDAAKVDAQHGLEHVETLSRIVHDMVTGWTLHESEPAALPVADRPLVALDMERLMGVSVFVLSAVVKAIFEHIRMGKANGTPLSSATRSASPARKPRSASSRRGTR